MTSKDEYIEPTIQALASCFEDLDSNTLYGYAKDVFRERIARYVGDDPELAERIRLSSAIRSKTIQLLRDYDPTKY